ncbi:MAG: cysteine hydrolase [Dehalococcoidia bacterium]|nr:cysteine hydrolase [Dehalococcoidia bacterium]
MPNLSLDLKRTAVLALDFQKGIVAGSAMAKERNTVQKAKSVLDGARLAGLPVVYVVVQFREGYPEISPRNRMFGGLRNVQRLLIGGDDTQIDPSITPVKGDVVVARPRVNGFFNSQLQTVLVSKDIDTLVLMGIASNLVVESTARYAADSDYRVIVLEDCCASFSVEAHNFVMTNIFNRIGEVSSSTEFLASLK